jgi:hypothetical protein
MRHYTQVSDIIGLKLEIYHSRDINEARDVAVWLHSRGYTRAEFSEALRRDQYKTYSRIVCHKGDEPKQLYFVEYLAPINRLHKRKRK